ncbi:hypothetical protein [Demetria terragena]|uniref:hypothetical protein n=1 Tax=Demetria terragena TaxID=63959 RepID=UPI0003811D98|nr:hypothetical protein [Demetria terragena]
MLSSEGVSGLVERVLLEDRLALSTYFRDHETKAVKGWFRSLVDFETGNALTVNVEDGATEMFITATVGNREYVAIPDGENHQWISRDLEAGEFPDVGMNSFLWLLGVADDGSSELPDGSWVFPVDYQRAVAAAGNMAAAKSTLQGERTGSSQPKSGCARVWVEDGILTSFALELNQRKMMRIISNVRLVEVGIGAGIPSVKVPGEGEGDIEIVKHSVDQLLKVWAGPDVRSSLPPDPSRLTFPDA